MDEMLRGGNITPGVVRIGATVRRPRGPRADFGESLLRVLNAVGFRWAPRFLGRDDLGRDVLEFVDGSTTDHPSQRDERSYERFGAILRELHDVTRGDGLAADRECVVHGDPGPFNVVMRDGMPAAIIDWDSAHPGSALEDVGYAAWTWCVQSAGGVPIPDQGRRLRAFRDGYDRSMSPAELLRAIEAAHHALRDSEYAILADRAAPRQRRNHARAAVAWVEADSALLHAHRATFERMLA
jgi:hypothetical protein